MISAFKPRFPDLTHSDWLVSVAIGVSFLFLGAITSSAADPAEAELIGARLELLQSTGSLTIGGTAISSAVIIPQLYARRDFTRAWTVPKRIDEMIDLIGRAEEEGLDPDDYHHAELVRLRGAAGADAAARVDLDLLLTDSLARYAYHLIFGKVDPQALDSTWNLSRELAGKDPALEIQAAIDSASIETYLDHRLDRGVYYYRLKQTLADYRSIAGSGGWPRVAAGPTLKPGTHGPRVAAVRARLDAEVGRSDEVPADRQLYDAGLEERVRDFQRRHGLDVDGAVGPASLTALNVTADQRVDQIRVNMERTRWVFRDLPLEGEFVIVNIAAFETMLVRDRKIRWRGRSQVGKTYRKTPVFRGDMKYLVFNPTWTVPPGILRKDILPAVRSDPGYLERKNMKVIDASGAEVDPASVDWTAKRFPYAIRQGPGPNNALGRVKFIFPNSHFVFLHDTPSRAGFERTERTFSSGCIRVDRPLELAELLLDDPGRWNAESIQAVLDAGEPKTVFLEEPLPVMLLYWTVDVISEGGPRFLPDVYERDGRILEELDEDFKLVPPTDFDR